MADVIYANHMEPQAFNAQEQSGMQTASNDGLYLEFVQASAGDAAAESHKPELTETMNDMINMKNQTIKLSRDVVRQKKCLILVAITFAVLLGVGLATIYMLTKNQGTQPIGKVGVGKKTLANLLQYIDEQRKYIIHGIIKDDLKQDNKTVRERLQIVSKELKSAQEYFIKNAVMEAGENYTIVDGSLFWSGSAPGLTYDVAYNVCAKYWSTIAQIKNRREYDAVMSMLRPKNVFNLIEVWIGLEINFLTRQISPTDGFTKWNIGEPTIGQNYTKVVLLVSSDLVSDDFDGMVTFLPSLTTNKVLCQL
ncbi:uncharacterized protein LOC144422087 isoform X2 [Styela clava]